MTGAPPKPHELRAMQRSIKHLKVACIHLRHLGPNFAEIVDSAEWTRRRVREELRKASGNDE